MAHMHDDDRRTHRSRDDDDDDRERVRGTGGYDPYDRRRGHWAEEYGGRRGSRYGAPDRDDEDGWQRDRERSLGRDDDEPYRYGRSAMRSGNPDTSGWYGTRDHDRYALGGRYGGGRQGSESMGGTVPGVGSMAGKGPKGYKRSDERIREDVCDCLTDDPALDASGIEVKVKGGEVTLNGTVDSRHAKRHAEDLVDRVSGVKDVHNGLGVQEGRGKRSAA